MGIFKTGISSITNGIKWPYNKIVAFSDAIVPRSFFSCYKKLRPDLADQRRGEILRKFDVTCLSCKSRDDRDIELLYVSSGIKGKTNNAVVMCPPSSYQHYSSGFWKQFLASGADVVLWNPTQLKPLEYADELHRVIDRIQEVDPKKILAINCRCATSDPSIKVVADRKDKNIHLIVDRGYGDAYKVARSFIMLARLPFIKASIRKFADCRGREKIQEIVGKILFLHTKGRDHVLDYKQGNFTRDLESKVNPPRVIEIDVECDHWSTWREGVFDQVLKFLADVNVINSKNTQSQSENLPPLRKRKVKSARIANVFKCLAFSRS